MAGNHVLILGAEPQRADGDEGQRIASILEAHGLSVIAASDPDAGMAQAAEARLIVVDQVTGDQDAAALTAAIRATPGLAQIPVLCLAASEDVEERVRFLEAGADDVMARPFDALELEARVDGLLARAQPTTSRAAREPQTGPRADDAPRLVAFFGPKGGSGTTTLAVNVAAAIAASGERTVALVDLDLQWGDVLSRLDLASHQTIADLISDPGALAEREHANTYAQRHSSGLAVFGAPQRPDDAGAIGPADVTQLLAGLGDLYDMVLVDAGSAFDAVTQTVIEHADRLVVVIVPEIPALRAARTLLEILSESDRATDARILVLNHLFARDMLKRQDLENALGAKIDIELPYDPSLYLASSNAGEPITTAAPRSAPGERLLALAGLLLGRPVVAAPPVRQASARPSLTSLIRRG